VRFVERRKAVGCTQEELAALVGVDRSTVVRWERAETEPQPLHRPRLAEVLQVSAEELSGLLREVVEVPEGLGVGGLAGAVPLDFSGAAAPTVGIVEGFTAADVASRRQVLQQLGVLGGAVLLAPLRQWVAALPVGAGAPEVAAGEDVEELEQAVRLFRRWDAAGVGGLRRKALVGQLNAVTESLADVHAPAVRQRLFQVTAELAQLAGWMSYDEGLPGLAQRYYVLALHACREAGVAALGAKVIGDMTQLSTALGHFGDSLSLVRTGLYALPRGGSRLVRSELLGLEARACAQLDGRDASDAARSAEACVEVWQDAAGDPAPGWMHYMNQSEVDCLAANAFIDLALRADEAGRRRGFCGRAEHFALSARDHRAPGYDRSRILDEIRLARVRLAQREPAESAAVASAALCLAGQARSSVVCDWLIRHHRELCERHLGVGEVAAFHEQLREYLRRAAPAREAEVVERVG
jgi:DNA-binding XRE family transcriptional regulator